MIGTTESDCVGILDWIGCLGIRSRVPFRNPQRRAEFAVRGCVAVKFANLRHCFRDVALHLARRPIVYNRLFLMISGIPPLVLAPADAWPPNPRILGGMARVVQGFGGSPFWWAVA